MGRSSSDQYPKESVAGYLWVISLGVGTAIGAGVGAAIDHIGAGIGIGVGVGVAVGLVLIQRTMNRSADE